MSSVLDKIVASKWREIEQLKVERPLTVLRDATAAAPPPRDFFAGLAKPGPIRLIAEVKKASPSAGVIRDHFDPIDVAMTYERHGATCLSVLTDGPYFQGSLADLRGVREAVDLPVLRKDFILDEYQLYEARAAGADAVLLIAECLDDCNLRKLHDRSVAMGMSPLIELYDAENIERVLAAGATLVGVNNRDLRTFKTDIEHTLRLRERVPEECVLVAESGIRTRADVLRLEAAGIDAVLVGETLMSSRDIGAAVDSLLGRV
ncbi:MAG TPA: indole-3-glycerol phosphate synthase TrpC [Pirellulales bacterium]|nr:indole-3-glycerol phosphate synthase TrpC [Pirellulales bacterium]